MDSGRAVLLIADIGGSTDDLSTRRMSLAHAEVNTGRMLDAVPEFDLIGIPHRGHSPQRTLGRRSATAM